MTIRLQLLFYDWKEVDIGPDRKKDTFCNTIATFALIDTSVQSD